MTKIRREQLSPFLTSIASPALASACKSFCKPCCASGLPGMGQKHCPQFSSRYQLRPHTCVSETVCDHVVDIKVSLQGIGMRSHDRVNRPRRFVSYLGSFRRRPSLSISGRKQDAYELFVPYSVHAHADQNFGFGSWQCMGV